MLGTAISDLALPIVAVDLLGAYQGGGFFALRSWANANGALLQRFLGAYIEATRMALDPANRIWLAPVGTVARYVRAERIRR